MSDVATIDVEFRPGVVVLAPDDQTAHVVLMHMRHDHRVDLVALQAERAERLRQVAGLPDRACWTGIDQDAALPILDEILIEEEPNSTRPGGKLCACRLFDLGRRASRKVVIGHVCIPVRQRRHGEPSDADLCERGHRSRCACRLPRRRMDRGGTYQAAAEKAPRDEADRQGAEGAT
ncbi:hypothetical protein D3C71_1035000 [compost metagenome]